MVGVGVLAGPLAAKTQQAARTPRIGVLAAAPGPVSEGLRQGLRELGYTEDRNIFIEWQWTEAKAERTSQLASELVQI